MLFLIQSFNAKCDHLGKRWAPFAGTFFGKVFLNVVLLGPLTFVPTLWEAWTAPNIDVLRTFTWPFMFLVNLSALYGLMLQGTWQNRLMLGIRTLIMLVMNARDDTRDNHPLRVVLSRQKAPAELTGVSFSRDYISLNALNASHSV